jgi:glucose-1-phosphate thymidylyltransferase
VEAIEERQGLKIGCIEEIAYQQEYISRSQLHELAQSLQKSSYGQYLLKLVGH